MANSELILGRGGGQESIKIAETNATTSMTYGQVSNALGSSINTTLINNLSDGTKTRLKLIVNTYVFDLVHFTTGELAFTHIICGSEFTARYWNIGYNNNSFLKVYTSSKGSVTDSTSSLLPATFAGTWAIYLV